MPVPSVEEGIFSLLNNSPEIQAVLAPDAGGTNCRLYPGHIAEEATLPAAAFTRAGGRRQLKMSGPDGLIRARFQFTAASSDKEALNGSAYDDCRIVMDAIILKLEGFSGGFPNGIVVQQISVSGDLIDDYDAESELYFRHCDFEIVYNDPNH
jgi:hypothetical protein